MIADLLTQIAMIHRQVPEEEFEADIAVETAIDGVDREVTDEERAELEGMLPEWLEESETQVKA